MHRIKLILEYDGSNYHGYQRQKNAHTIQEEIESGILKLVGQSINTISAGRTDTGVHALGQVVAFDTDSSIPPEKWSFALNSVLPPDIRVISSELASSEFHPRYDAISKIYNYKIYRKAQGKTIFRNYALCMTEPLNIPAMQEACKLIIGKHNFKSFCASGSSVKNFERTVMNCAITEEWPFVNLEIEANGFLYNMVRIIMGTLLEIGQNNLKPEMMSDIIKAENRALAGPTAPPQGLYMVEVKY
ncbi:MAG: tRNA pseudouridine(38-40) synthase TruA [Syntrophomonadaceae bacterium]|nr:tRNA pseudouridine(38-40) synthase TruA [Syntrophomonadaceae bacterium]